MRVASVVLVLGCVVDDLTTPSVQPGDVPLAVVGDSTVFLADSTRLDASFTSGRGPFRISWSSSNIQIARVDTAGWVIGERVGSATIVAHLDAPELVRPVEVEWPVRVRYSGIQIEPVDSITGLGETRVAMARGVDARGTPAGTVDASFLTDDDGIVEVTGSGTVTGMGNGTASVAATFDGLTTSVSVRVRQVATRITFATSPVAIAALEVDTAVAVQVWDTNDSLIVAPAIEWGSSDPTAVSVDAQGTLRALRAAGSIVTATVDTVTAQLPVSVAQVVTSITATSSTPQSGVVANTVPQPPAVMALDATGNPIAGAIVVFSIVSGSGGLVDSVQVTDANGVATLGSWVLGTGAGEQRVMAKASQATAEFAAIALPGPISPHASQLFVSTDTLVAGETGTASLVAHDEYGNALTTGGATVEFTMAGGVSNGFFDATDDQGNGTYAAVFNARTAGNASLLGGRINGTTVTTAGPPVAVLPGVMDDLVSVVGSGQSAPVNTVVAIKPAVRAVDVYDNPVSGVEVTYNVTQGNGQLTGATVTTGADGVATVGSWRYGTAVGAQQVQASAQPLTASFAGTATHGPASVAHAVFTVAPDTIEASDSALVQLSLRDAFGNQVTSEGYTIAFSAQGGGSDGEMTEPEKSGATYRSWFRGTTAGSATNVLATINGDSVTSATPTVTVISGAVGSLQIIAGNGQTADAGTTVSVAPSVLVRDTLNNPIEGVTVTFLLSAGGGSVSGASQLTDASGMATLGSWTLGTAAGANALTVQGGGFQKTFTATGVAGPAVASAATITLSAPTVAAGSAVTATLTARDQFGNATGSGGATVVFSHQGGTSDGAFGGVTDVGDGTYTVSFTGSTAGTATTVAATYNGVAVTSVAPTVTVTAGAPAEFTMVEGDGQVATVGTAVPVPPAVRVQDALGNPVIGVPVSFSVAVGGGSVTGGTPNTDATGVARVASWRVGTVPGANELSAAISGFDVEFDATAVVGPASTATSVISVSQGTLQAGGAAVLTLTTFDQYGNPVPTGGNTVVFMTQGGGSAGTISPTSDGGNGVYTATFTGTTAGSATFVRATINGVNVTTAVPTITVQPGAPAQMEIWAGNNQSAAQGTSVATAPAVRILDAYDNPVPGVVVTFAPQGNTSVTGNNPSTAANGVAAVGSWKFGLLALGQQQLVASTAGLSVTFLGNSTLLAPPPGDQP